MISKNEPLRNDQAKINSVQCNLGKPYAVFDGKAVNPNTLEPIQTQISESKFMSGNVGCYNYYTYSNRDEFMGIDFTIPKASMNSHDKKYPLFSNNHFFIKHLIVKTPNSLLSVNNLNPHSVVTVDLANDKLLVENNLSPYLLFFLAFIVVVVSFLIWFYFGRETTSVFVPKYLHTIPDKNLKPWEVDFLINGKSKYGKNGFAAMFFQLHLMKIIKNTEKKWSVLYLGHVLSLTIDKDFNEKLADEKILRSLVNAIVVHFKKKTLPNGDILCEINKQNRQFGNQIKRLAQDDELQKRLFSMKGFNLLIGWSVIALLGLIEILHIAGIYFSFYLVLSFAPLVFLIPDSIFARYKNGYYKSFLEWTAFKNMLDDFAMIKKYFQEDYNQWKDWLLYGVALGSSKNVLKNLKETKIISDIEFNDFNTFATNALFFSAVISVTTSNTGSSGGGSVGGFGGGGIGGI